MHTTYLEWATRIMNTLFMFNVCSSLLWEQGLGQHLKAGETAQYPGDWSSGAREDVNGPCPIDKHSFIY